MVIIVTELVVGLAVLDVMVDMVDVAVVVEVVLTVKGLLEVVAWGKAALFWW